MRAEGHWKNQMATRFLGGAPTTAGFFRLVGLAAVMLAGIAARPVQADYIVNRITADTSPSFGVSPPSIDRGFVAYLAYTSPSSCCSGSLPGYQQVLVTQASTGVTVNVAQGGTTEIPGAGGERFGFFLGVPSIDAGQVAFLGVGLGTGTPGNNGQYGIYLATPDFGGAGYSLRTVVDRTSSIPGGNGTFSSFGSPFIANGDLVFSGTDTAGKVGIYKLAAGQTAVQVVADQNTPVPFVNPSISPGAAGNFSYLSPYPTVSNGVVAFTGESSGLLPDGRRQQGLFFADVATGAITARADRLTGLSGLPGSNDTRIVTSPTISVGSAVFLASLGTYPGGPYYDALYFLPQTGQGSPIIQGGQQFQSWPGLDRNLVALVGDSAQTIISNLGSNLGLSFVLPSTVLRAGEAIDSSGTTYYGFPGFLYDGQMGPLFHQSADYESQQITFRALLGPPGWDMMFPPPPGFAPYEAILVVSVVPEPTSLAMFAVGLLGLAGVSSARRRPRILPRRDGRTDQHRRLCRARGARLLRPLRV